METVTTPKLLNEAEFLAHIGAVSLPKFFGVHAYENGQGEVSNYTVLLGNDYAKKREADAEKLRAEVARMQAAETPVSELRWIAANKLLAAIEANSKKETASKQSKAQTDAYHNVTDNVRQHKETGEFYINGFRVAKTVLQAGSYGPDTRGELTKAQDQLKKDLNLLSYNYRQFCIGKLKTCRLNGETLEILAPAKEPEALAA